MMSFLFERGKPKDPQMNKKNPEKEKKRDKKTPASTNRQDESVQKHVSRAQQGKAGKSGETKYTATKPTGTKTTATKPIVTTTTGMSHGKPGGDYRPTQVHSTGGAGSYSHTMRANPGTGRVNPLYRPEKHTDAVHGKSAAKMVHTNEQMRRHDPNITDTAYARRTHYKSMKSSSLDDHSHLPHSHLRQSTASVDDSEASYRNKCSQFESAPAIQPSVGGSSIGNYGLRRITQIQTHAPTDHTPMEIDDPDQGYPNRNRNEYQNQQMETEYQASFGQRSSQLQPVLTNPLDQNSHSSTHFGERVHHSNENYLDELGRKSQEREELLRKKPESEEAPHKIYGDERHAREHVYHSSSAYLADQQREEEVLRKKQEWEESTHKNYGNERHAGEHVYHSSSASLDDQNREELLRKKQVLEEFDPLREERRRYHTDPSDENRHSTRDDSSDYRHAGESFQQQSKEQDKASNQRHRTQSEYDSRRTVQTEADRAVSQDSMTQSKRRLQRQESRYFHNFKDKDSFIIGHCYQERGTEPTIYVAHLQETSRDPENKVKKVEFGKKNSSCQEKVVMLVGSTGSGKSTMINAVVNYMFGIDWDDQYRLKLINEAVSGHVVNQAVSQTGMITAYTIHHQPWFTVPYTLTIVDTPGFGDTGGLKRDKEIMDQIRKFFETQGSGGIDHLDAVGFVTQAAMPRLSPTQRYIFDSIMSIFGKDIAQNIFMLLTFADGQKPQVLSGLKEANMEYQDFYKFNNSALYVGGKKKQVFNQKKGSNTSGRDASDEDSDDTDDDDDESSFNQMFWKMGTGNFNRFMNDLESVKPRSLQLTAEVLQERNELEITVNKIQEKIKVGLKKLDQLKMEQELLKHHQADIDKNRDFTYDVDEWVIGTEDVFPGESAMNCKTCKVTCHLGKCRHMVGFCGAFSWSWRSASCRHCPYYCSFSMHEKQPFKYIMESVKVTRTSSELKRRYEEAEGKKLSAKQLIERCSDEFEVVQTVTLQLMERARKCLRRLDEIALKPNPLSTTDYIDLMIQEEEFIAGPGWKVRQDNS